MRLTWQHYPELGTTRHHWKSGDHCHPGFPCSKRAPQRREYSSRPPEPQRSAGCCLDAMERPGRLAQASASYRDSSRSIVPQQTRRHPHVLASLELRHGSIRGFLPRRHPVARRSGYPPRALRPLTPSADIGRTGMRNARIPAAGMRRPRAQLEPDRGVLSVPRVQGRRCSHPHCPVIMPSSLRKPVAPSNRRPVT
jgi:hypothetical protein